MSSSEIFRLRRELGVVDKEEELVWFALDPLTAQWRRLPPMPDVVQYVLRATKLDEGKARATDQVHQSGYGFVRRYLLAGAVRVVEFLKETFICSWVGALWGKLYEPLVHRLLLKGGDFVIKPVYDDGSSGPETSYHIGPHIMLEASSAGEFGGKMGMGKSSRDGMENMALKRVA
ncbi:hypothetical protein SELMODRAFT_428232 [Selaginella moellendorffii]|uniref:Uncharacterized protein n=1 Tax=Selaginella moellendorffii TaxID=88036 RepID=D8T259_SELML|nr:hypothetical protein SELMODRAFT_428232 [Selaginella moellendorffii]